MNKLILFLVGISFVQLSLGQYCTTGGPASTLDSNVESVTLVGASGSINYIGCPGIVGLEEDLAQTTTLNASGVYTANIQFGTCGNNYAGAGEAWIDYNQNMIFEASESIGTWSGTPPTALSNFLFVVPANAVNGPTRMRVMHEENGALPLNPCAGYSWGSMVDFTIVISGGSGTISYCEGGPAATGDSNVESVTLNGASGTSINYVGCPGVLGVEQSLETVNLGVGNNFQADIQFGTCGGNFPGNGEAWIDYNQNYIFEASESIGTWTGTPPTSITAMSFTVPMSAILGPTKMRVQQQESSTLPLDPCAAFTWGSVVDFNVVIEPGVDCSAYPGDNFGDAILVNSFPYVHNHQSNICYSNQNLVYNSPDVFYLVIPDVNASELEISLCNSAFDTHLSVFDTQGNVIAINDDNPDCGTQSKLNVSVMNHDSIYVVVEGWDNSSGIYELTINNSETLSLNNLNTSEISLYPNPTTSHFNIDGNFDGVISIIDAQGKVLLNKTHDGQSIDVTDFERGLYIVKLSLGNSSIIKKLIVQ